MFYFLGAFAYSREAPINYVMSVRVSAPPRVSSRLPLYMFTLNVIFRTSVKICQQPLNLSHFYWPTNALSRIELKG